MTENYGGPPYGELSDTELDAVLSAVDGELLGYVRAAARPTNTLLAIMAADERSVASPDGGRYTAALIEMRSIARDFTHHSETVLGRTRNLVHTLVLARDAVRSIASYLTEVTQYDLLFARTIADARNLVSGSVHADSQLARSLIRDLADILDEHAVRDRNSTLTEDLDRAISRLAVHDLAGPASTPMVHDLERILELARDLTATTNRVRRLNWIPFVGARARSDARRLAGTIGRDLDRLLDLARDRLRSQAEIIASGLSPLYMLASMPVDASGADLSRYKFRDLAVLEGIIWTPDTIWPSGISDRIFAHSDEIRPGVHMVTGNKESDPQQEIERLVLRLSMRLGRSDKLCGRRPTDSLRSCDDVNALAILAAWSRLSSIVKAGERRAAEIVAQMDPNDLLLGRKPTWTVTSGDATGSPRTYPARHLLTGVPQRS